MKKIIILILLISTISLLSYYLIFSKNNKAKNNYSNTGGYKSSQKVKTEPTNRSMPKYDTKSDNNLPEVQGNKLISNHIAAFEKAFHLENRAELNEEAKSIIKIGKPSVPQLMDIIINKNYDSLYRKMIFEMIREIGYVREANLLIKIMNDQDDDPLIRGEAAWTLGKVKSLEAVEPLIEILKNKKEEERVRKLSAVSLGLIAEPKAEGVLTQILHDQNDNDKVRAGAAEALGCLGSSSVLDTLIYSLDDENWQVQVVAAQSLAKIGGNKAAQALNNKLTNYINNKETSKIDDAVIKSIITSLSDIKSSESVPILINILKGEDPLYSALAGEALGKIGDKKASSAIEEVLNKAIDPLQIKLLKEAYEKLSEFH